MDLSIILVTFNASPFIRECLCSLIEQAKGIDHEVIVVDNDSRDETCRIIEIEFPQIILIRNPVNLGFAAANNIALRKAKGEFVLMVNPDTRWKSGKLEKAIKFLRDRPKAGGLGARIIQQNGSWQKSFGNFPTLSREFIEAIYLQRFFHRSKILKGIFIYKEKRGTAVVEWVSCTFFLCKKDVLAEVDYLDERYFMYYEDIDLSKKIWKSGKEIYYYPEIEIVHFQISPKIYDNGGSPYLYFHKHFGLGFAKILRYVLMFKFLIRVVIFSTFAIFTRDEAFMEKRGLNKRSLKFHFFEAGKIFKIIQGFGNVVKQSPDKNCHC